MSIVAFFRFISRPLLLASTVAALSPGCIIPLNNWNLQLPTGSTGSPATIGSSQLEGCDGFQDQFFYYGSNDATLVMTVPGLPDSAHCVTTPNSKHCRTELRESNPSSWDPKGPANRMEVFLAVVQPDNSDHGTVIGQIHIDDSVSSKPVCELYYNSQGKISLGVEMTRAGGNQQFFDVGTVPVGQTFSYIFRYENNVLSLSMNNQPGTVYPTFSLNAPPSYFKAGNYNQGSSRSEVHFFVIDVSHDPSGNIPGGAPAPPASTISFPGIGPIDIIKTFAPFPTFSPSAQDPPPAICDAGPGNSDDNTATVALFKSSTCCDSAALQTFKIGTFDVCHVASDTFDGITQSVGANLFNQDIHIKAYFNNHCGGSGTVINLSNSASCSTHESAVSWGSFAIVKGDDTPKCDPKPPAAPQTNEVTVQLYSDNLCCGTVVETANLGSVTGECHKADGNFQGLGMSVGSDMFNQDIHAFAFFNTNCEGNGTQISLSNDAGCIAPESANPWQSFSLLKGPHNPIGSDGKCTPQQPDNQNNDNTVTLNLYVDSGCCLELAETAQIGNFDPTGECHVGDLPFNSFTQTVGGNLFNKNINIFAYFNTDCSGQGTQVSLSNNATCYGHSSTSTWGSFKVMTV